MTKGQMSMEYIVKTLILLVVLVIVVGLIIKFRYEILLMIKNIFPEHNEHNFPEFVEKDSFSAGEISAYIESCYSTMASFPEDEQEDIVCYLLQAKNGFAITKTDVENKLSLELKNKVGITTNFGKDLIKIEYIDLGNTILVRD